MQFWHDQQSDALIYPTLDPRLHQAIPDAAVVQDRFTAVRRTLHNSQILRLFDLPVLPVVTDETYDWPAAPGTVAWESQRTAVNFMVLNPRCFNLSEMGCVDAETEYLSPTGWRRMDMYDGGLVAQYHLDGRAEFVQPTSYVIKPCPWMYRFKTTRGVDQKLSPEHRVLYINYSGRLQVTSAQAVAEAQETQARGWRGRFITTFVGGGPGIALSEAQLRIMVAVIADGSFPNKSHTCTFTVKKERKKARIRMLLREAQIVFREKDLHYETKEGYTKFSFTAPRRDKVFTPYYWSASQQQLQIVADECWRWDGSKAAGSRGPSFCSTIKESADFIQYAFAATGQTASLNFQQHSNCSYWDVFSRTKPWLLAMNGVRDDGSKTTPVTVEVTPDGKKYCFEVPTSFLVFRRNGCIFVSGNTGKTLAALWTADFLSRHHAPEPFRVLIIAPLSTLDRVWASTIFKTFLGRKTFEVLYGTAEKRMALLSKPVDIYLLNPDGVGIGAHTRNRFELDGFSAELANRKDIRMVIIDEASVYKDAQTKRHRIARMAVSQRDHLVLMSGTPTPNAPTDAYGLAKLVNNAFGKSFTSFRNDTMFQQGPFRWMPKKDGYEKARALLHPAIRFDLATVWDGPPMTTQQRSVPLTKEQTELLKALKKDLMVTASSGKPITAANEAAARQKAIQISLGAIYDDTHQAHKVDASPRVAVLKEIIEQVTGKVIVFAPLTSVVDMLAKELKEYSCAVVNGPVSQKDRNIIFRDFQESEKPRVLIADPGTMSHGLDLFAARTTIWFGPTDRTELYIQANRRAFRPGQKFPTAVVQIISNALEAEIFRRLENNTTLQGSLLRWIEEGTL